MCHLVVPRDIRSVSAISWFDRPALTSRNTSNSFLLRGISCIIAASTRTSAGSARARRRVHAAACNLSGASYSGAYRKLGDPNSERAVRVSKQPELAGFCDCLNAIAHLQLAEDLVQMPLRRAHGDRQLVGDLLIGQAAVELAEDLDLGSAQGLDQRFRGGRRFVGRRKCVEQLADESGSRIARPFQQAGHRGASVQKDPTKATRSGQGNRAFDLTRGGGPVAQGPLAQGSPHLNRYQVALEPFFA